MLHTLRQTTSTLRQHVETGARRISSLFRGTKKHFSNAIHNVTSWVEDQNTQKVLMPLPEDYYLRQAAMVQHAMEPVEVEFNTTQQQMLFEPEEEVLVPAEHAMEPVNVSFPDTPFDQDRLASIIEHLRSSRSPEKIPYIRAQLAEQIERIFGITPTMTELGKKVMLSQRGYIALPADHELYAAARYVYNNDEVLGLDTLWVHASTLEYLKWYQPQMRSAQWAIDFQMNRLANDNIIPVVHVEELMTLLGKEREEQPVPVHNAYQTRVAIAA